MEKRIKPVESHAEKLARFLAKAHEQGIQLLMDHDTERWYATSGTVENIIYAVSERGCSCQGFKAFGRCKHFALYLDLKTPPTEPQLMERLNARVAAQQVKRHSNVVTPQHAANILMYARQNLASLIEREEAGETVPEADKREATAAIALYSSIASPAPVQAFAAD